MIPYLELRSVAIGPLQVPVHWTLLSVGILLAHYRLIRRARRLKLDPVTAAALSVWMVVLGFVGSHFFKFLYFPEILARGPGALVRSHVGMASFGGLAGGLLAAALYFGLRRIPFRQSLAYLDAVAFVFPSGWIFGRLGCSLVHDHPGIRSPSVFAVQYPGGARFDMAVLEVFFLLALLVLLVLLDRSPRTAPFYLALFLVLYGPFRVLIDQLHVDPPRYLGVSVDQWAGAVAGLAGAVLLFSAMRRGNSWDSRRLS